MIRRIAQWAAGASLLLVTTLAFAANHVVLVGGGGNGFSPSNLTIQAGDTVTFRNAGGFHNVVADDGSFQCSNNCKGTGNPSGGAPNSSEWSQTLTFANAGVVPYYCTAHGALGGHGFQLEKVNDTTVTAFWFTFDANGNQVWILGVGQIADNRIEMQAVKSRGGRFPPNFDPTQITNPP